MAEKTVYLENVCRQCQRHLNFLLNYSCWTFIEALFSTYTDQLNLILTLAQFNCRRVTVELLFNKRIVYL